MFIKDLTAISAKDCWTTGEARLKAVLPLDGHIFEGQMAFLAEVEIQEE